MYICICLFCRIMEFCLPTDLTLQPQLYQSECPWVLFVVILLEQGVSCMEVSLSVTLCLKNILLIRSKDDLYLFIVPYCVQVKCL